MATHAAFDPLRLDVAAFAKEAATLTGRWPLVGFSRLVESAAPESRSGPDDAVTWQARGDRRKGLVGESQACLRVTADACLALSCQRCLEPVSTRIEVDRRFVFVPGEDTAAQLDADSDDDVLALTRALDLRALIEDELLLALPLVPRHAECPEPLRAPADDFSEEAAPHAFAALAGLKRGGAVN